MAFCQGHCASKGPRAPAADCCKRWNHAPCMIFHCLLEQLAVSNTDSKCHHVEYEVRTLETIFNSFVTVCKRLTV